MLPLMEEIKATPNHNVRNPLFNAKEIITLAIRLSMQRDKRGRKQTHDPQLTKELPSIEKRIANVMIFDPTAPNEEKKRPPRWSVKFVGIQL